MLKVISTHESTGCFFFYDRFFNIPDIKEGLSNENMVNIYTCAFFVKFAPSKFFLQVDIFKITPTGRSQKRITKKRHILYNVKFFA